MKKLAIFLLLALSLAACNNDLDGPKKTSFDIISFENSEKIHNLASDKQVGFADVTMNLFGIGDYTYNNVVCAKPHAVGVDFDGRLFSTADQQIVFHSYYSSSFDTWGGVALAQSPDMKPDAESLKQQFSVWATAGAEATRSYGVFYDSNSPSEEYPDYMTKSGYPIVEFMQARVVDHLYIANSTYVYNYFKGEASDSYKVQIVGWLKGVEVGRTTEVLVSGATKLSGWRKVGLVSLGEVDKLTFKVLCNYAKDPTYFCIDEIALQKLDK